MKCFTRRTQHVAQIRVVDLHLGREVGASSCPEVEGELLSGRMEC